MNYYQTLGVRDAANPVEILCAYQALTEAHKNSNDIETQLEINIAYQTLIHPAMRQEYDASLPQVESVQPEPIIQERVRIIQNSPQVYQPEARTSALATGIVWCIGAYACVSLILVIALVI